MRTFVLQVTPWHDLGVWRTLELTEEQSLHDLHGAIQRAFELDDDHLYAFFLNNRAWDRVYEYGPAVTAPHAATDTRLGSLPLRLNKRLLYLFDFGAELRHEVKVIREGEVEPGAGYPRVVDEQGEPPRQYPSPDEPDIDGADDERGDDEEPPPAEALTALVPALREALRAYDDRSWPAVEPGGDREPARQGRAPEQAARERDVALALLQASGGDRYAIHRGVEHALERSVNPWLGDLPRHLSDAGLWDDAASLSSRLREVVMGPHLSFHLPLILARAGQRDDALEQLDTNLAEHPDDPDMLVPAAEAALALGDLERAEACCREALGWAGSGLEERERIVVALTQILASQGRPEAIAALGREEQSFRQRLEQQRAQAMGLVGPEPYRRETPKVGRNEPCPCGSGKKYKKCCG